PTFHSRPVERHSVRDRSPWGAGFPRRGGCVRRAGRGAGHLRPRGGRTLRRRPGRTTLAVTCDPKWAGRTRRESKKPALLLEFRLLRTPGAITVLPVQHSGPVEPQTPRLPHGRFP